MKNKKNVQAFDESSDKIIDLIYDKEKNEYYIPYNPMYEMAKEWHANGYTGSGLVTAVLDTGLMYQHPLLKGKIIKSIDFTGEGLEDINGHGTMVALILAVGAPGAKFFNVKILDQDKCGFEEDLIDGIKWAAQNGADFVNISSGVELNDCNSYLCDQIDKIIKDYDIIVSAAAGNDPNKVFIPACCESVFSVGAADYFAKKIEKYSSKADFYQVGAFSRIKLK